MRSVLFVPANRPDRIDKAVATEADVVMVDLEDAVPPDRKADARQTARRKLKMHAPRRLFVRINGLGTGLNQDDLDALAMPELKGIMLPKVETTGHLMEIHRRLTAAEESAGTPPGSVMLMVLIESVLGVHQAAAILSRETTPPRRVIAAFGAADYALDLGIDIGAEGVELIVPRTQIAWSSRIAERDPPIDTPCMLDFKDPSVSRADALRAKQLGFQGKLCIHPSQIAPCNEVFSPSAAEIAYARRVTRAYEESVHSGVGVFQVDGKFIDKPVVERCRRILSTADAIGPGDTAPSGA